MNKIKEHKELAPHYDQSKIESIIYDVLSRWGIVIKEARFVDGNPQGWYEYKSPVKYQLDLLAKELGLEYFKKEIKETNGEEKEYVQEGFRKIRKSAKQ